jgi:hypothetical protein
MDIYETPEGKVVTTGSFSVAEWDEYLESLPKSKRDAVVAPPGSVTPVPEDDGASAADDSEEPKAAPAKTSAKSSASNTAARKTAAKGKS